MARFYSPSTGGFYSEQTHGARMLEGARSPREMKAGKRAAMQPNPACTIPADAVEVSDEAYAELMAAQAQGRQIALRGGRPAAVERNADPEEQRMLRRRQRDQLLAASDWTQLPDAPLDEESRGQWLAYRQALRDLDMDATDWPLPPAGEA